MRMCTATAAKGTRAILGTLVLIHIPSQEYYLVVKLIQIYECLCVETRLRVLHLLTRGPLCVCQIQAILREPQVEISKHLAYLQKRGLVEYRRKQNWKIYQLPVKRPLELETHLKCLQDCAGEQPQFAADLKARALMAEDIGEVTACVGRSFGRSGKMVSTRSR